jgi:hypothetical protein
MRVVDVVVAAAAINRLCGQRAALLKPVLGVNVTFRFVLTVGALVRVIDDGFTSTQIGTLIVEASAERADDLEEGTGRTMSRRWASGTTCSSMAICPSTGGLWAVGVGLEESEHDILDGIAWSVAERA